MDITCLPAIGHGNKGREMTTELDRKLSERVIRSGDESPGTWNLVADLLEIVAAYSEGWIEG